MALLIVKEAKKFFVFSAIAICITLFTGLPLASVLLSMSAGHKLISHNFKIHINTIVLFTHFYSKLWLRFRNSGYKFVGLFLISYTCHKFILSHPRYNQLCVYTLSSLANVFQKFLINIGGYTFSGRIAFDVCPFESQTLAVCETSVTTYTAT
jgi:hypothetical protein